MDLGRLGPKCNDINVNCLVAIHSIGLFCGVSVKIFPNG